MLALALAGLAACAAQGAADRFDYDAGGRLIRRVDDQSRGNDYVYDGAGNLLQVTGPAQTQAPTITSGPLPDLRRNEARSLSVAGTALSGLAIRASDPGIVVTQVVQSAGAMSFRLAVSVQVPLGRQELVLQGASGTLRLPFNVLPAPAFSFDPYPIGLPPDNLGRRVTLLLGEPPTQARTYSLSTLSPAIARTTVGQITVAPGQTQADFGVAGVAEGSTVLRLFSTDFFEPVEAMISVFPGGGSPTTFSRMLQISRGQPLAPADPPGNYSMPISISRGTPPWSQVSRATFSSALLLQRGGSTWGTHVTETRRVLAIQRGVPWASPSTGGFVLSGTLQLQRQ